MIDRHPDDLTYWYDDVIANGPRHSAPTLLDTPPEHKSTVLGPDGAPLHYNIPRRRIGFDLRKKENPGL